MELCVTAMAAAAFGGALKPLGLPTITIFIFFGVAVGPFGLGMLEARDIATLDFVNQIALGFIGLSAGGKFLLPEILKNWKTVLLVLAFMTVLTWSAVVLSALYLSAWAMPFMSALSASEHLSAALFLGCLASARSPSSAIAIVEELHAKGQFTTVVLAVTVALDVVVVLLFSVTDLVVSGLEATDGSAQRPAEVIGLFVAQTLLSVVGGALLGRVVLPLLFCCENCSSAAT